MKKQIKSIITIISVAALLPSCVGDIVIDSDYDDYINENQYWAKSDFNYTVDITNETVLSLLNVHGDIVIEASTFTDRVIISGEMGVSSHSVNDAVSHLDDLAVQIELNNNVVDVESVFPPESNERNYSIYYHILIPADFKINVVSVNGWIQIVAVLNDINVENYIGDVDIDETYGNLDIELVYGDITCKHELVYNGDIDLKSTYGNIDLSIPVETSCEVYAQSTNGNISTSNLEFSNQIINPYSFFGVLNTGDGLITLNTTYGDILLTGY